MSKIGAYTSTSSLMYEDAKKYWRDELSDEKVAERMRSCASRQGVRATLNYSGT